MTQPPPPWQAPQQPPASPASPSPVQPPQPQPADRKKRRRTMIVVGVVVAVVLAIAAAAIILTVQANRRAEEEAERAAAERLASAAAAVQGLFDAIAAGDSTAALGYVDLEGGNSELITDEVLAASAELAPITDIVVTPPTSVSEKTRSAEVSIGYLLGGEPVEQTYQVRDPEQDNTWIVDGAVNAVTLYDMLEGLDLTLNGVPLTTADFLLLPGAYEIATTTTYFTLTGDTEMRVTELYHADSPTLEAALNDDGVAAFREAVTTAVDECVASTTLEAGCGLTLPEELDDGTVLEDDTIERSLSDDAQEALETMEPTLSYADPTVAEGSYIGAVDVKADCTQDDRSGTCELIFAPSIGTPSVTMTDPDLAVSWD